MARQIWVFKSEEAWSFAGNLRLFSRCLLMGGKKPFATKQSRHVSSFANSAISLQSFSPTLIELVSKSVRNLPTISLHVLLDSSKPHKSRLNLSISASGLS